MAGEGGHHHPPMARRGVRVHIKGFTTINIGDCNSVRAVTTTTTRVMKRARATRAMTEPSPRKEGDDGPPAIVHNNQLLRQHQW